MRRSFEKPGYVGDGVEPVRGRAPAATLCSTFAPANGGRIGLSYLRPMRVSRSAPA